MPASVAAITVAKRAANGAPLARLLGSIRLRLGGIKDGHVIPSVRSLGQRHLANRGEHGLVGGSSLRGGVEALSPKTGVSVGTTGGGWSHAVYTMTPGVPGDSGSAFLDADGKALGTLSTLAIAPLDGRGPSYTESGRPV